MFMFIAWLIHKSYGEKKNTRCYGSDLTLLVLDLLDRYDIKLNNAILAEDKHKSM